MSIKKCSGDGEKIPKDFTKAICKGCGIYIEWVKTEKGKNMPVDPNEITIITDEGKMVKGRIPHWATCPKANKF